MVISVGLNQYNHNPCFTPTAVRVQICFFSSKAGLLSKAITEASKNQAKLGKLDCVKLFSHEIKNLHEAVDMLTPLRSATHFTQREKVVTSSFAVPCVKSMM